MPTLKLRITEPRGAELCVTVDYDSYCEPVPLQLPHLADPIDIHAAYARAIGRLIQDELNRDRPAVSSPGHPGPIPPFRP